MKTIKNVTILMSVIGLLWFSQTMSAQALKEKELKELQSSFNKDRSTKALQNILSNDKDLRSNALNREKQGQMDHYFKYRVNVKGITDQKSSGRCWMFTSMNVIRPEIIKKYNLKNFDFSHNYLYFWDMLEKSNLFLENIIRTANKAVDDREVVTYLSGPIDDGGVWNLYFNVADKYGLVPASVMPETAHSDNTGQMVSIIKERLRTGAMSIRDMAASGKKTTDLRNEKTAVLKDVYRVLALCLGEPPTTFTWRYETVKGEIKELKNYTPMQFYKEVSPEDYSPSNYVMIMNDPTREYYKVYALDNYRNTYEGVNWVYLNLPNEDIKEAALASIKNNEGMYASCDVGKQFQRETGILDVGIYDYETLFGITLNMNKKDRILSRQSGSAHAMVLIGCDVDENDKPVKWEFENSWGANSGNKGYLTFSDQWFDEYMFRVVIHKKYLNEKALKAADSKPIALPVWDYMY